MVKYPNPSMSGFERAASLGDGYTINMRWYKAYPRSFTNKIAYHLYYSTNQEDVFDEGVKYIVIDDSREANIVDLTPGQDYWFSVRPVEYDPTIVTFLSNLPVAHDNVRFYPTSMLRQNMSATDLIVPLLDVEGFPNSGFVKIGGELIQYLAVDPVNDNLIVPSANGGGAFLVLQPNGKYYIPAATNIGTGTIDSLTLLNGDAKTETWTVRCISVPPDDNLDGYARFETFGSVSGNIIDQYGNYPVWQANGEIVSNGTLSFSISEDFSSGGSLFKSGDYFTIQSVGATIGTSGRGFNNTVAREHTVSGFDGYHHWSPIVSVFAISEDSGWDQIYSCKSRFEYPNFPFTMLDGYHQVTQDYLSTDYAAADAANVDFPMYDYAGYHRTDPVQLLNGTCVGSYIGGQMGCIDGYGNYNIYRGLSLEDQNTQRQDMLLSVTGQPAVLIQRVQTGITCSCYLASSEYQDDRCPSCYGTKFVLGYQQYFNPRQSDGRIMVRLGPTAENLKMYEAGMESEFPLDIWTITVPTIKTRDVLVLFDQNNNESFRYEVASVTRNQTILGLDGGQHLASFRIRKTDPAYQIRIFRDTAMFPETLNTSLGFAVGLPPHSHTIVVNESVLSINQINQTTGVSLGHNHEIVNGIVQEILGHSHSILLP